jgi:small GTP-binding protein
MIGDDYFKNRSEIEQILADLRHQAEQLGADIESLLTLDNLRASLKDPFVFVVVGEVNVGKSTFLNALFGQDFSRTGIVPTTDKILFFKHGDKPGTRPVTPTLDEVSIPCDFLKDFHIVDTPGTNSIQDEHQQITERFVPVADLVIFVFSAINPWGASAWQFLEKVHRQWMRNVIFVLQQSDLRSPEEIQVITDYMRQLCQQRFGRQFPLFPVSAKHAYLARSSGIDREGLLNASGFPPLETYISSTVTRADSRSVKLRSTLDLAAQNLVILQQQLAHSQAAATRRLDTLQELATECDLQVQRTLMKIQPAIDATERDYHESAIRVANVASEILSTRSAFNKAAEDESIELEVSQAPPSLDYHLFQDLQKHNSERWRQVALILTEDVSQYERYLQAKGQTALPAQLEAEDQEPPENRYQELRHRFTARVDSAIRRFVVDLELDQTVEPGLLKATKRARLVPKLVLPAIAITGIAFYLQGLQAALAAALAGMLSILSLYILTRITLSGTKRQLIDKLEASSPNLHALLSKHVQTDVEAAFTGFAQRLKPAIEHTSERTTELSLQTADLNAIRDRIHKLQDEIPKSG